MGDAPCEPKGANVFQFVRSTGKVQVPQGGRRVQAKMSDRLYLNRTIGPELLGR